MAEKKQRVNVDLPFEMVVEIVSRLPAKSLLRFKSVCKDWYYLINSSKFIEKYHKDTSILVTTRQQMYLEDEGFYKSVNLESLFSTNRDRFHVVGVCNGIVCVQFCRELGGFDYIIGNPTIRDFRLIPSPKLSVENALLYNGFSSFLNDYKIVRVISYMSSTGEDIVKAEVYTLGSDTWVEIDVRMGRVIDVDLLVLESCNTMPVLQNGVFYWKDDSSDYKRVVSFDISESFYDEINIPTNILDARKNYWWVVEFEKEISLIIYNYHDDDHKFDLWARDANENSWRWKLRVDLPIVRRSFQNAKSTITVAGYKNNGDLLIVYHCGNVFRLLVYNLISRQAKHIPYFDVQMATGFYFYTESLLTVRALNEE